MRANDCLKILRQIKDAAFATVDENGKPQIRIIDVMLVEEETLFFCTARGKDFYRQLLASQDVAVTAMNSQYQMIRICGKAKKIEEQKARLNQIFEENPSMKDVYPGNSRYILEVFCIEEGEVEFFDLGQSPIYRESFTIGGEAKQQKGFRINGGCIQCGTCHSSCPQKCIKEGALYEIVQEHCLHCGLCYENCPVKAVERREL